MTSDNALKDHKAKDGLVTAITAIDVHVKHAEEEAEFKPMTGRGVSFGSISISDGTLEEQGLETKAEVYSLGLAHGKGMVIGRQEGGGTEYLNPGFRPTQRMPGSRQRIVLDGFREGDNMVSRGHFTLVGSPIGIIFINGVPRRGGGIRPPRNGTLLIEPDQRKMVQGERIFVGRGQDIKIRLPNHMEVLIAAA